MQDAPSNDPRTHWAERRTDWAEDRTVLACERTFAGWMRTGMAALAVAIGLRAVFGAFDPTWVAKAVASLFVAIAIAVFWAAAVGARRALARISCHQTEPQGPGRMIALAVMMSLGALAVGGILWML